MSERVNPVRGGRVLDIGCGTGNLLEDISSKYPEAVYTGIDVSPGMLAVARRKLLKPKQHTNITLIEVELMDFLAAQPDDAFDVITSVNVLYTVGDQPALWAQLMRVLAPSGTIVVTTSVKTGSREIIQEHLAHAGYVSLVKRKLLSVFVIDALINLLGRTGHFAFADEATLAAAISAAGGVMRAKERCYGGAISGVNIIFDVTHQA